MIGKNISHHKILEKLGEARLHFGFVGQGEPNYAIALLDGLPSEVVQFTSGVYYDW